MGQRVLKWLVSVDDKPYTIGMGQVLLVDCQGAPETVMVWTLEEEHVMTKNSPKRIVQVFGTGQPLPDFVEHLGSVVTGDGALVWHVFALMGGRGVLDE